MITNHAVMGNMGPNHQMAVIADFGQPTTTFSAGIDGDIFTNIDVITNLAANILTGKFQVLRYGSNRSEGKDLDILSDPGVALDDDMGMDLATFTNDNIGTDNAIRTDFNVIGKLRTNRR